MNFGTMANTHVSFDGGAALVGKGVVELSVDGRPVVVLGRDPADTCKMCRPAKY